VARNRELLGKAAIANAKMAYKRLHGHVFMVKASNYGQQAQVQRPPWASTGTKIRLTPTPQNPGPFNRQGYGQQ